MSFRREVLNTYDFIDEWRMEPCLWNDRAEGYRDKSARESALKRLAEKFNMNGKLTCTYQATKSRSVNKIKMLRLYEQCQNLKTRLTRSWSMKTRKALKGASYLTSSLKGEKTHTEG